MLRRHCDDDALQSVRDGLMRSDGDGDAFLVGDTRKLVHTWTIPSSTGGKGEGMRERAGTNAGARYRYFRLRSGGPIAVRGFELFGRLIRE